jgi:predicted aconitase with swiveling domain
MEGLMEMKLKGHMINRGYGEGEAIVYRGTFSWVGDLDLKTGTVPVPGHELEGQKLANKVFVCITGHGGTGGPYFAYKAKQAGYVPAAMICVEAEPVIALAAIAADIPMVDRLEKNPLDVIKTGDYVKVDATNGIVEVTQKISPQGKGLRP